MDLMVTVFLFGLILLFIVRDEYRDNRYRAERSYLIKAILAKHLPQLSVSTVIEKQDRPVAQDYHIGVAEPARPAPSMTMDEADLTAEEIMQIRDARDWQEQSPVA